MGSYSVYKHTTPAGKVYIGLTMQAPCNRWAGGIGYKSNAYFYKAIKKYGWDNIKHEVIAESMTAEEAEELEIKLIAQYDSTNPEKGYNHSTGGKNMAAGYKWTEEQLTKISELRKGKNPPNKGKPMSLEQREKLKKAWKKRDHALSEETKRKIGEAQRGHIGYNKGIPAWNKGRPMSEESKQRLRDAKKSITPETRQRMSEAQKGRTSPNKGKTFSEETRRKLSEAHKGKGTTPVICIDTGIIYSSIAEAAEKTGVERSNISRVCNGERKKAGGLCWKYV